MWRREEFLPIHSIKWPFGKQKQTKLISFTFLLPLQNSSVEGIFPSQQKTHPFRIIETDAMSVQSMVSLGRVGRILAGSIDPSDMTVAKEASHGGGPSHSGTTSSSSSSTATSFQMNPGSTATLHQLSSSSLSPPAGCQAQPDTFSMAGGGSSSSKIIFHEPDVIASTKLASSKTTDSITQSQSAAGAAIVAPNTAEAVPVAPPRRRKKGRKVSTSSSDQVNLNEGLQVSAADKVLSWHGCPFVCLSRAFVGCLLLFCFVTCFTRLSHNNGSL